MSLHHKVTFQILRREVAACLTIHNTCRQSTLSVPLKLQQVNGKGWLPVDVDKLICVYVCRGTVLGLCPPAGSLEAIVGLRSLTRQVAQCIIFLSLTPLTLVPRFSWKCRVATSFSYVLAPCALVVIIFITLNKKNIWYKAFVQHNIENGNLDAVKLESDICRITYMLLITTTYISLWIIRKGDGIIKFDMNSVNSVMVTIVGEN